MEKYNISKVKFDQIFTGAAPDFPSSKKFDKVTTMAPAAKAKLLNGHKNHQQTMSKYITKIDKFEGNKLLDSSTAKQCIAIGNCMLLSKKCKHCYCLTALCVKLSSI